jgi:hypothetical protein
MRGLVLLAIGLQTAIAAPAPQFSGFPKLGGNPKGGLRPAPKQTATKTNSETNSGAIGGFGGSPGVPTAAAGADPAFSPAVAPPVQTPTSPACRRIAGDEGWPADEIWKEALPGVIAVARKKEDNHPNYRYSARNHGDIQAAVNFATEHHVRLSVIASGHDFLGR